MKKISALLIALLLLVSAVPFVSAAEAGAGGKKYDPSSIPRVLPAVRSWTGDPNGGYFDFGPETAVSAFNGELENTVVSMFTEMCGVTPRIVKNAPEKNALVFKIDQSVSVNEEGYLLDITPELITVTAKTEKGLLYGAITVSQLLYSEGFVRCGKALDEPAYPVRSGMIDVGRVWVPLDYVEEIAKYMAWFKLNEIHLHINDCNGSANANFRLESDVPGLSSVEKGEKRYYTKDEYRAFQKRMLSYGMTVVTEIDTPAHSAVFGRVTDERPPMLGDTSLDIRDENRDATLAFVTKLFDEYLLGDDPVFVGKVVHIGTDEYDRAYSEEMRKYTAALAQHIHSRGYIPRFWAGFGPDGFPGETELPKYLQGNMWDNAISGLEGLVEGGYDFVNTLNSLLYVVPTGNGFPDYLDLRSLYSNWQVNLFNGWGHDKRVAPDYEHLLGACFALWNDLGYLNYGITYFDIFDRVRGMTAIVAEKTWCGNDTAGMATLDFLSRYESLSARGGFSDPGRHKIADVYGSVSITDFNSAPPEGVTFDGKAENGKFILDGASGISFDSPSFGFPGMLDITLTLDEIPDVPILSSRDGQVLADADGKGHVGFTVDKYTFIFDYSIPTGEETRLSFVCDGKNTVLIVNGVIEDGSFVSGFGFGSINTLNLLTGKLSNFVVPLETVGKGVKGSISSLCVTGLVPDTDGLLVNRDLAYKRPVCVSGLEVSDGRFAAELAVDGDPNTRLSFARDKDEQWLIIDLGAVYDITYLEIDFFERVESYDLFVSVDGAEYTKIHGVRHGSSGTKAVDKIKPDVVTQGRYVKYVQNKRNYYPAWNAYYSGGINDFRVYSYDRATYNAIVNEAVDVMMEIGRSDERYGPLKNAASKLENYLDGKSLYRDNIEALASGLKRLINEAKGITDEQSEPVSEASVTESAPESVKSFPAGVVAAIAAAVAAVAVALTVLMKKRKK